MTEWRQGFGRRGTVAIIDTNRQRCYHDFQFLITTLGKLPALRMPSLSIPRVGRTRQSRRGRMMAGKSSTPWKVAHRAIG